MEVKVFKTFDDWKKVYFPSGDEEFKLDKSKNDPSIMGAMLANKSLERAKHRLSEKNIT